MFFTTLRLLLLLLFFKFLSHRDYQLMLEKKKHKVCMRGWRDSSVSKSTHTLLAADSNLIPSTYVKQLTITCNSRSDVLGT